MMPYSPYMYPPVMYPPVSGYLQQSSTVTPSMSNDYLYAQYSIAQMKGKRLFDERASDISEKTAKLFQPYASGNMIKDIQLTCS